MRFSIALTALIVIAAAGCAKAPMPVAPAGLGQGQVTAAATPTVRVGQIEKLPVRCPCFKLEGTIGTQTWTLQFEQQGAEVAIDLFDVGGKKAAAAQKKAIAQGIYAEAEEAMTQEAVSSAERARQLFAIAAELGVKGAGKGDKPAGGDKAAFKVDEIAKLPVRCPCFKLTAKMAGKDVTVEYEVHNGFAGEMHQISKVTVAGQRPTADELKAIAAGLKAEGDVAMKQEATNSAAKAKLYYALSKAMTR